MSYLTYLNEIRENPVTAKSPAANQGIVSKRDLSVYNETKQEVNKRQAEEVSKALSSLTNSGKKLGSTIGSGFKKESEVVDVSPKAEKKEFDDVTGGETVDLSPNAERNEMVETSGSDIPGYAEGITKTVIEDIIRTEAKLRNMGVDVSLKIFYAEGATGYQSNIKTGSQKKEGGREASYGPYQLYTGAGLGKEYEKATGLKLSEENTLEGITRQIQFALDKAAEGKSWQPWYGREKAGVSVTEGLTNAKPLYNWRKE